ncbi:MAG: patatin-like protein [Leptolyngbyaceae cyanobacterium RU_5_1]|nr:patatin-like protein [Leptolyngbyaceae cyanobacterium RU_5_1]
MGELIKALTDADIVVDIISGTSAGGINGVLLSYALANSTKESQIKFQEFANVWKESGDIQKLLFEKDYDGVPKASFFNGVGYYKSELEKALKNRRKDLKEPAPTNDWFSKFDELDLFVTGTDILGRIFSVFDNTGRSIEVKDHHTIFHLRYRESGANQFIKDDVTCEALAKLCQITSCFPVAFPPVTVKLNTKGDADAKLVEWGDLKNRDQSSPEEEDKQLPSDQKARKIDDDPGKGPRLHFVDGGVLDNRPFSYTIKEIYRRTAERPVFRKLFYVDPSPDRFQDNPKYKEQLKPDVVQVALDSLIGMPRYESINNDLEQIKEHNRKVRRYHFLLSDIENLLDQDKEDDTNVDIYDQQKFVYLRTRLISLKDKILPLIFLETHAFSSTSDNGKRKKQSLDEIAELLLKPLTDPQKTSDRLNLLQQLGEQIRGLDVEYALREHFFITGYVYKLLDREYLLNWMNQKFQFSRKQVDPPDEKILDNLVEYLRTLIKDLNHNIKILECIQEKLYDDKGKYFASSQVNEYLFKRLEKFNPCEREEKFPDKFFRGMLWLHGYFLSNVELTKDSSPPNFRDIDTLKSNLESNLDELFQQPFDESIARLRQLSEKSVLRTLSNEVEDSLSSTKVEDSLPEDIASKIKDSQYLVSLKNKLKKYFVEFEKIDTFLYPLDYLAGVSEKQQIETYRISPEDAQLGLSDHLEDGKRLRHKLAGDSLNAFGGFLKKSWRANDILWGRLDGLNRIIEALVTESQVKNFSNFVRREAKNLVISESEYLDRLLNEVLPSEVLQSPQTEHNSTKENTQQKETAACLDRKTSLKTELKTELERLLEVLKSKDNLEKSLKEWKEDHLQKLVNALVMAGHLAILDQGLKDVIKIQIGEQLNWAQQKSPDRESKRLEFKPRESKFSSSVNALAVSELAEQALASMSLSQKEEFFRNHYQVGQETLESIPKSELKQIILRFMRIFQDILRTWRRRSRFIHSKFWNRLGFAIAGFVVIQTLNWFIRRF